MALSQADQLADASSVGHAYDMLAMQLESDYANLDPLILVVMTGGFVAAAEILRRVKFPFSLDYIDVTRYHGDTSGGRLRWRHRPEAELSSRHVLVIDDILDEGYTLLAIRNALAACKPVSLRVAVLVQKQHDRRIAAATAEYVGLHVPDRYVFGCGMDYKGYWRQLPEIYAVKLP